MTGSTTPFGGYALVSVSEAGGEETLRFEATLTKDGRRIAHVSNGGTGGAHSYRQLTADGWKAIDAFEDYAKEWNASSPYAGYADGDALIDRLVEVAALNRMRKVTFLLDDMDYFSDGRCYESNPGETREQLITLLRSPQYASRNPRVWDKGAMDFVPVT